MTEQVIFSIKKVVSIYLNPVTIGLEIIVIGVVMIIFSRRKPKNKPKPWWRRLKRISGDLGLFMAMFGIFALYCFSIEPVADSLMYGLEKRFAPISGLDSPAFQSRFPDTPKHIVVLAGGSRYHEKKSPTSQLSPATTARVLEGVRLHQRFPDASFIVTGRPDETKGMANLAATFGVYRQQIIQETESRDTKDHPLYLEILVQSDPFILVTSATHMPRAYALFLKQGLEPIPAPCDFWVWPKFSTFDFSKPDLFVPKVIHLYKTDIAFHEYLGLAWARLRDQTAEAAAEKDETEAEEADSEEGSAIEPVGVGPVMEL